MNENTLVVYTVPQKMTLFVIVDATKRILNFYFCDTFFLHYLGIHQ